MADHVCLKFTPDVAGEATVEGHEGWIDISHFSMGGGRAVDLQELQSDSMSSNIAVSFNLAKTTDKASAPMWESFLEGKRFDEALIHMLRNTKDGGNQVAFEIKLKKAVIESMSYSAGQGGATRGDESFTLQGIVLEGEAEKQVFSWDFIQNKKP